MDLRTLLTPWEAPNPVGMVANAVSADNNRRAMAEQGREADQSLAWRKEESGRDFEENKRRFFTGLREKEAEDRAHMTPEDAEAKWGPIWDEAGKHFTDVADPTSPNYRYAAPVGPDGQPQAPGAASAAPGGKVDYDGYPDTFDDPNAPPTGHEAPTETEQPGSQAMTTPSGQAAQQLPGEDPAQHMARVAPQSIFTGPTEALVVGGRDYTAAKGDPVIAKVQSATGATPGHGATFDDLMSGRLGYQKPQEDLAALEEAQRARDEAERRMEVEAQQEKLGKSLKLPKVGPNKRVSVGEATGTKVGPSRYEGPTPAEIAEGQRLERVPAPRLDESVQPPDEIREGLEGSPVDSKNRTPMRRGLMDDKGHITSVDMSPGQYAARQQRTQALVDGYVASAKNDEERKIIAETLGSAAAQGWSPEYTRDVFQKDVMPRLNSLTSVERARLAASRPHGGNTERFWNTGQSNADDFMKDHGVYKDMELVDTIEKNRDAFASGNYAAQIGAIYGVAHANDPGSRITDKDYEAAAGINLWSKIKNWVYGSGPEPQLEPGEIARLQGVLDLAEKAARERLQRHYDAASSFAGRMPKGEYRDGGTARVEEAFGPYGVKRRGTGGPGPAKPKGGVTEAEKSAGITVK